MPRTYTFTRILLFSLFAAPLCAQTTDTTLRTNKDAVYNRPFVLSAERGLTSTALGGYVEANTNYFVTDGVEEGFSMELRRFNVFVYSTVARKIRFLSEIEFEHGTEEINIENAMLDFEFTPAFNFRGGILLPPIGYFNQNHDSPKWDFIDRPLVSTTVIPSTLSEVGFGFHGRIPVALSSVFTYELYLVNGLRDGIINNELNRTDLQSGKSGEMFAEDNNGSPMFTGRVAYRRRGLGEFGLSCYGGTYNTYKLDGFRVDNSRTLRLIAADLSLTLGRIQVNGEFADVSVDVPAGYFEQFGSRQRGFHTDVIVPVWSRSLFSWNPASLNALLRYEYIDYNAGDLIEGIPAGDEISSLVTGLSLRIESNTVIKFNYRYQLTKDILSNPAARTAGFQFGLASYF